MYAKRFVAICFEKPNISRKAIFEIYFKFKRYMSCDFICSPLYFYSNVWNFERSLSK